MKKIITLLIPLHAWLLIFHAEAQSCLPEGITFTTQEHIDSFQVNYPGCNAIEGDVQITYNITNLNGLSVLTSIGGDLAIYYNGLTNLTGLEGLTSIGGGLEIGTALYLSIIKNRADFKRSNSHGYDL